MAEQAGFNDGVAIGLIVGSVVLFVAAMVPVATHQETLTAEEERQRDEYNFEAMGPADTLVAAAAAYTGLGLIIDFVGKLVQEKL